MEIKVKLLDGSEEKGVAQVEEELLKKHEESLSVDNDIQEEVEQEKVEQEPIQLEEEELSEEKVLSYIGKRYNKEINSFDELMAERNVSEEIPSDVAAYMKYKKDTGRGFEDFVKLNKDFDNMDSDDLLRNYLQSINLDLDSDDIESLMEDYQYDEDLDDESFIKKTKILKKKTIGEAKKYFNQQKEQYSTPLESRGLDVSDEEKQNFEAYKQYIKEAANIDESNMRKREWFDQKTNEVFSDDFKGFDFNINNKKILFSPGNVSEIKKHHSSPQNFINKFLDENGLIKDAEGYHKSLAMAMNPDKFAKFFYEQGQADATNDVTSKMKNINMSERKTPEVNRTIDGMQVKSLSPESDNGLKIRSIKRI